MYHLHCLLKCIRDNKKCPTCRKELVFEEEAAPNVTQENEEDQVDDTTAIIEDADTTDDSTETIDTPAIIEDADTTDDTTETIDTPAIIEDADTTDDTTETIDTPAIIEDADTTDDTTDDTTEVVGVNEDTDTTDDTDDTDDMRLCAACLNMYTSASYSKNQYSKGPGSSRCQQCVATHNW